MKKFIILLLLALFSSCSPSKKVDMTPKIIDYKSEYESKAAGAESLFRMGSYSSLKEAFRVYQELLSLPVYQEETKEKLVKTALLLTLREKELAILDGAYLKAASELIEKSSSLSKFAPYVEIVDSISMNSKGVLRDIVEESMKKWQHLQKFLEAREWVAELKNKAKTSEFEAYLFLSLNCPLYFVRADVKEDFSHFLELYPESSSIKFKQAACSGGDKELLTGIIESTPEFHEAYYFLGEIALRKGKLITAETNYLKCYEEIPLSTAVVISLASVYFGMEEVEKGLEFYEKALEIAPEYRDALLGKAICLSYLGRSEEAIDVCNRLISLGNWYLGESYYWLALNQHELGDLESSSKNVEKSKPYLPTSSEVFTLSGIIALDRGELKKAEEDLKTAINLSGTNCEPLFYLGKLYTQLQEWRDSGLYFERAALCNEFTEKDIRGKIEKLSASSLTEERKERIIRRKEGQLKRIILTKGTAYYNAAAGYFNSGLRERALTCAQKACSVPSLKQKAEELILRIKEEMK